MVSALTLFFIGTTAVLGLLAGFFYWRWRSSVIDPETVREWTEMQESSTIENHKSVNPAATDAAEILDTEPANINERVREIDQKVRELTTEVETLRERWATAWLDANLDATRSGQVEVATLETGEFEDAKALAAPVTDREGAVVLVAALGDGSYAVGVSPDLTSQVTASGIIEEISNEVGGEGGGTPEVATGGGAVPSSLPDVLRRIADQLGPADHGGELQMEDGESNS